MTGLDTDYGVITKSEVQQKIVGKFETRRQTSSSSSSRRQA